MNKKIKYIIFNIKESIYEFDKKKLIWKIFIPLIFFFNNIKYKYNKYALFFLYKYKNIIYKFVFKKKILFLFISHSF